MNALLPSRPVKPILGSGGPEGGFFTAIGDAPPFLAPMRFVDALPSFAQAADGLPPLPELPEVAPALAETAASPPATAAPPPTSATPFVPPAADPLPSLVLPPPVAPFPPAERIVVESLGPTAIRVTGTSQGDRLVGGPGDDRLDGLAGDDILLGSPGRDLLYGGAGQDTIRYDLLRAEVSLDTRFQRISLEDGQDQYDGIEIIDLRDGDWFLTASSPAALVQRLWLAATGHVPSAAEMIRETAALQAGGTAEALAARLGAGAGEAVQLRLQTALEAPREGRLDQPAWLPDAEAVLLTRMAELALGGTPGRDDFLHWLDELEAGVAPDSVAAEMLATQEGRAHAPLAEPHALALAASSWML